MSRDPKNIMKIPNVEEDLKSKQEKITKETRKLNREESLMKKRKEKILYNENTSGKSFSCEHSVDVEFIKLKEGLISDNLKKKLNCTIEIRRFLSIQKNPPIEEVIKFGMIPIFLNFLKNNEEPQLQFEAAWVLTNIASGSTNQTFAVVEGGGIELFIKLLESPNNNVKEQSIWALGNITGDSPENRNKVLEAGILFPLIRELELPNRISFTRNAIWTLSNLCRGKPSPESIFLKKIIFTLEKFIFSDDSGILADVCWAFSYISDGSPERIQMVIDSGIVQRLTELLMHSNTIVQTPALRVIGNVATGDDLQTQILINCGALPCLLTLLSSAYKSIKKEACWTISNITAGNPRQIQSVIDANIMPTLIYLLKYSETDIKKEAAWAISNATSGGTQKQINYLVKLDCISPMIELLTSSDSRVIKVILEGLENILEIGNKKSNESNLNIYTRAIEQAGGLEKLENLQHHSDDKIYEYSVRILEKFFGAEEEVSDNFEKIIDNKNISKKNKQIPDCFFGFVDKKS
mmetsp:Transcript_15061/g.29690  ORF Transcript_15061/g.29690 Transcript_15061/m.29690 type:complete len:522 (+) Transcript_15061:56-1621(+)